MKKKNYIPQLLALSAALVASSHLLVGGDLVSREIKNADGIPINNPIIIGEGVCDPHIHIFDGKAYLFASHDDGRGNDFYVMKNWWVWSSTDLIHWTKEFTLYPEDTFVGATNNAWAVDAAERNGKHYFYVSGNWKTVVAVSEDGPDGPYIEALGEPLHQSYDPSIFFDDDENRTPYLLTGGFPYKITRMNEDMLSLAEESREVIHTGKGWDGDGGFLHKRNGIYYINGHGSDYSTATNVYGPYEYRGKFFPSWIDHPTFFNWNNQTYCAYGLGDDDQFFRKTNITYVHYKDNGEIVADVQVANSSIGVGQYDSGKAIQAEWYFAASDETQKKENAGGFEVGDLVNKSYLHYPNVHGVVENTEMTFRASSDNRKGGMIEIREGSPKGKLLGKCKIPNTGGWSTYKAFTCRLQNEPGVRDLYLVFKGKGKELMRLDSFDVGSLPEKASWGIIASHGGVKAGQAIDGDDATRWDSADFQSSGMWVKVNFGVSKDLDTVELLSQGSPNDGPVAYKLYLSSDGKNWGEPVATGTGEAVTTIRFPKQSAQYIKITQDGTSSKAYWSIHELNAYLAED